MATIQGITAQNAEKTWYVTQLHSQDSILLLTLQVCVRSRTLLNVVIDGRALSNEEQQDRLKNLTATVESVLAACRSRFTNTIPKFGHIVQAQLMPAGTFLQELPMIETAALLPLKSDIDCQNSRLEDVQTISINDLETIGRCEHFLPASVRVVRYRGQNFTAKGPVYASHVKHFLTELKSLAQLPQHRNIVTGPLALISAHSEPERICGFLMPFYPQGNLDIYSQACHAALRLFVADIIRWFRETLDASIFLYQNQMWHGDIKPDNLLVDGEGSVCLTDFTRTLATSATASPEVRDHCRRAQPCDDVFLGIPADWSLDRAMASEIYSIGRTIFLVMTAQSMLQIYEQHGWVSDHPFQTEFSQWKGYEAFSRDDTESLEIVKQLVLSCTEQLPTDRPASEQLMASIESVEARCRQHDILVQAHRRGTMAAPENRSADDLSLCLDRTQHSRRLTVAV